MQSRLKDKQTLPAAPKNIQSLPQFASQALLPVRVQVWIQWRMTKPVREPLQMPRQHAGRTPRLTPHFRNDNAIDITYSLPQFHLDTVDDAFHAPVKIFVGVRVSIHQRFTPGHDQLVSLRSV
jgi:hypothetical protein